jgi:hypothetical protein
MTIDSELITTPFPLEATAAEIIAGVDLTGRRAIVTGASSGIGIETARALASAGADVTLAVRDLAAGARVAEDLRATTQNAAVDVRRLDLADLGSVSEFSMPPRSPWNRQSACPRCAVHGVGSVTPREQRGVEDVERLAAAGHGPRPLFGHQDFEAVG